MAAKKISLKDFEQQMQALEDLVERMENEELTLEEALACYEKGVHLSRSCQELLKQTEQKVDLLMKSKDGEWQEQPFSGDEEPS